MTLSSTRYGCTDENTTKFSKAAFQLLHKQYHNSSWAKKTKYWYQIGMKCAFGKESTSTRERGSIGAAV